MLNLDKDDKKYDFWNKMAFETKNEIYFCFAAFSMKSLHVI